MDYEENMEIIIMQRMITAGFINQMKNRNTSRKIEYDLKLIKNDFVSINT